MANLNPSRARSRGQILLIAAFSLAVIFVALALVVNSAIFTENLASRGEVGGSSDALVYQDEITDSVGETIEFANLYNTSDLATSVDDSVSTIDARGGVQQATGGQLVHVEYLGEDFGHRIADNASGGSAFLNESSPNATPDWRVAETVDRTRNVRITLTDTSPLAGTAGTAFTLEANESTSTIWEMRVWDDGSNVVVDVETAGGRTAQCRVPDTTPIDIDVTRGQVNGEPCHALTWTGPDGDQMWWDTGLSPLNDYDIWIKNGDRIEGNYSMIVDGTPDTQNLSSGFASGDDPYETPAIYSARIDYVYMTGEVEYDSEIVVAPGEPA